jgi:TolB-like protein/DNA-binding winged helix-turn-helix (wHTH) protein/Tfp pilus assembly protein PilF
VECVEFPPFSFDPASGELRKDGRRLKLHPQPAKVLAILVRQPGQVARREDIQKELWGEDTYVAFDLGINSCIRQIRSALGDDAGEPRFVQTVTGQGYRFIAPVEATSTGPPAQRSRKRNQMALAVLLVLIAVLAVGVGRWMWQRPRPSDSIAVLPLRDLSPTAEQEYFADGMTEALIAELSKIRALRVISRTTVMRYKDSRESLSEIARALDVDSVVEGSVLRLDDRVRITLQLVDTTSDRNLWARQFESTARDVLGLQSRIALAVAAQVRVQLTPEERGRLETARSRDPRAHDLYLKGIYYFRKAINTNDLPERLALHRRSFDSFQQAIQLEPDFAEAYAALAQSYHYLASIGYPEFYPRGKEAALKALEIDDDIADAHGALAFILHQYDWDHAGAEAHYQRAIALGPGYRHGYSMYLSAMARHEEAIAQIRKVEELDPFNLSVKTNVAGAYFLARDYERAEAQILHVVELSPDRLVARLNLSRIQMMLGQRERAIAALEALREAPEVQTGAAWGYSEVRPTLALGYALAGHRERADRILRDVQNEDDGTGAFAYRTAQAYAATAKLDAAYRWLDIASERRALSIPSVNVDPLLDGVRSDPRFQQLLLRIHLR